MWLRALQTNEFCGKNKQNDLEIGANCGKVLNIKIKFVCLVKTMFLANITKQPIIKLKFKISGI